MIVGAAALLAASSIPARTGIAEPLDPRIPLHVTMNTVSDLLPRPRIEALAQSLSACTRFNLGANFSRPSVATGLMLLRDGAGMIFGTSALALALVEPTRSGTVFASIGNDEGPIGTRYLLLTPRAGDRPAGDTASHEPVAILGGSLLDDAGARRFLRELRRVDANTGYLRTGSDAETVAAVASGRARVGVVRQGIGRPALALPPGLVIAESSAVVPIIGFARPVWLAPEDLAILERCFFAHRFDTDDAALLGGADRFVPIDSGAGLETVRAIGAAGGARFDRWNYWTASQPWR